MLTCRPLTEQDLDQFVALEQYAFPANYASYVSTTVAADRLARLRGVFAGDTLAAQLEAPPLRVQAGDVPAAGIAAVASAPQLRRRGHVALLLRHLADELRAGGVPLPFCTPSSPRSTAGTAGRSFSSGGCTPMRRMEFVTPIPVACCAYASSSREPGAPP